MIPLLPNIGYAEISSAGTLNDAMGSAKSKLPIQFFKLTDNISGNLTMTNDSAHKKIILNTNGKTITNSSGSPLTNNSGVDVELKGSGNIQCTLKTFTSAVTSSSSTGTTTITAADNSTMVVAGSNTDTTLTLYIDFASSELFFGTDYGSSTYAFINYSAIAAANSAFATPHSNGVKFTGETAQSVTTNPNSISFSIPANDSFYNLPDSGNFNLYTTNNSGGVPFQMRFQRQNHTSGFDTRLWFTKPQDRDDRILTFTNNLAIPVVLSGGDPFSDVTVAAGATGVVTRSDSTDGSFDLTGTVSGSNGDSEPYALAVVNNGTGSLITTSYTGTFSTSGL